MSIRTPALALLLLGLAVSGSSGANEVEPDAQRIMKEAEDLVAARERIGKELMAIVAESHDDVPIRESVPLIRQQIEAARLLGQLQYLPAIPVLIEHIDLKDPTGRIPGPVPREEVYWPLSIALSAYGNATVPQIVDAYLAERDRSRRHALYYVIRHRNTSAIALRYLRGTEPPDEDDDEARLKRQNMQHLEQALERLAR